MSYIKRRLVDNGVKQMLTAAEFPTSFIDRPDEDPDEPTEWYAIIYPLPGGVFFGSPLTSPEADAHIYYQATCVGLNAEQTQWVADGVRRLWCERDEHGVLVTTLIVDEHDVIDRYQEGPIGPVTKVEGVYQAVDTYCVAISRGAS